VNALDAAILANVAAGRAPVHGLGSGKTLARAQHATIGLLERGVIAVNQDEPFDPEAPAFLLAEKHP
jgi:hypothetical protein